MCDTMTLMTTDKDDDKAGAESDVEDDESSPTTMSVMFAIICTRETKIIAIGIIVMGITLTNIMNLEKTKHFDLSIDFNGGTTQIIMN